MLLRTRTLLVMVITLGALSVSTLTPPSFRTEHISLAEKHHGPTKVIPRGGYSKYSVADEGLWDWPVAPPHAIVKPFIAPATRYGSGHRGIDIAAPGDGPLEVSAPLDGIVHYAGFLFGRGVLSIQHPNGYLTSYEPVTTALQRGDVVIRGSLIGTLELGHCSALHACLHFGLRHNGEYLSPLNFLGGIPASVLLPNRR